MELSDGDIKLELLGGRPSAGDSDLPLPRILPPPSFLDILAERPTASLGTRYSNRAEGSRRPMTNPIKSLSYR